MKNCILKGDCIDLFRRLDSESVDAAFSDPPILRPTAISYAQQSEYMEWCTNWIYEMCRVVKNGGSVVIHGIPRYLSVFAKNLEDCCWELNFGHWIVWKLGHIEQFNKALHPKHTGILHFIKAQDALVEPKVYDLKNGKGEIISDLWEDINGSINRLPIPLMERIILLCTQEGDTILDCFMGSGSTAVAAKQLGRNYLGFELSDSQIEIAEERIKKAQTSKFKDAWVSKQDEIILSIQSRDYEKIKNDLSSSPPSS